MSDFENEFQNTDSKTDPLQRESWSGLPEKLIVMQPTPEQAAEMLRKGLNPEAGTALARLAAKGTLQLQRTGEIWSNIPIVTGTTRSTGIEGGN